MTLKEAPFSTFQQTMNISTRVLQHFCRKKMFRYENIPKIDSWMRKKRKRVYVVGFSEESRSAMLLPSLTRDTIRVTYLACSPDSLRGHHGNPRGKNLSILPLPSRALFHSFFLRVKEHRTLFKNLPQQPLALFFVTSPLTLPFRMSRFTTIAHSSYCHFISSSLFSLRVIFFLFSSLSDTHYSVSFLVLEHQHFFNLHRVLPEFSSSEVAA